MLGRRSLKPELVSLNFNPKLVRRNIKNSFGEMADQAHPNQPNPPPHPPPNPPLLENVNPMPPPQRENVVVNVPNPDDLPMRQFFVPNAYVSRPHPDTT